MSPTTSPTISRIMRKMVVRNNEVDIIIEMDQVEYMKISIEDKESVCIAEHFSKVYDFIEGAFNEQRTK